VDRIRKIVIWLFFIGAALPYSLHGEENSGISIQGKPEEWVVVFVHGIMSIKPHISFGNVARFFDDQISRTQYARSVKTMREDPHFFQNQAMQQRGLFKVNIDEKRAGNASGALASIMEKMEGLAGITNRKNHYYTYGWSGLLSQSSRYREAARFFHDLEALAKNFNSAPKIRIIGYSHGGCVSLNLAAVQRDLFPKSDLKIDELVLLATPLKREVEPLVLSPLFKRIYNLYSRHDRVQRIDIFNPSRYLSDRLFYPSFGFCLPDKLIQVELKLMRMHSSVKPGSKKYKQLTDLSNRHVLEGQHHLLSDTSPGHGEVWFFGWTPRFYRKSFPLYPLPMISILPFIQRHLASVEGGESPAKSVLVADARPDHSVILFKKKYNTNTCLIDKATFPSLQQFGAITEQIAPYIPEGYTKTAYEKHVKISQKEAKKRYLEKKKRRKGKNTPRSHSCTKHIP